MPVLPCLDPQEAEWLTRQNREWFDLAARGPLGYARYARVRFIPDPAFPGQREVEAEIPHENGPGPTEIWQIGVAVSHLLHHTTTPADCLFLIWEGWPDSEFRQMGAATVDIRDGRDSVVRRYYLFRGDADLCTWEQSSDAGGPQSVESLLPIPAFIWPADRAWCVRPPTYP